MSTLDFKALKVAAAERALPGLLLLAVTYVSWSILSYLHCPLRKYPGPLLARWSSLWRLYHAMRGDIHVATRRAHERYGKVIRTGPNHLELDLPAYNKVVYTTKGGGWHKGDWYLGLSTVINGEVLESVFSARNPVEHQRQKKPIAKFFSPSSVIQLEGHVNRAIMMLCHQLEKRFMNIPDGEMGDAFNLGEWIKMYAWDVIGELTFSKHYGYLEKGHDFDGVMNQVEAGTDYLAAVGQMPILDNLLAKNPILPVLGGGPILELCKGRVRERMAALAAQGDSHKGTADYLDRFIEASKENPEVVDENMIMNYVAINVFAGADTTTTTIKSIMYYSLRAPRVKKRLEEAILSLPPFSSRGDGNDNDDKAMPSYADVRANKYVEAVFREALRIHPPVSMVLPREVPPSSAEQPALTLPDGFVVPPGTNVGMNPWILGRNVDVYGPDVDEFRPERWLQADDETEDQFSARLSAMNAADLTFGAGSRICLGRHLAMVEIYKVVAMLYGRYEMEIVDPEKGWWTKNSFIHRQEGLKVRMRRRQRA